MSHRSHGLPAWLRFPRRSLLTACLVAATAPKPSEADSVVAGLVEALSGQAVAEQASSRRALAPRADVFLGDDVMTAENSRALLRLGRDTSLRLGASTQVRIDRFIINAGGTLTLEAGPLLLEKTPDTAGDVRIRGSFGLITVRGTQVFVGPSRGVTGIFVVRGLITVTAAGVSFAMQTGEGTDIASPSSRPTQPAVWGDARIREALASVN